MTKLTKEEILLKNLDPNNETGLKVRNFVGADKTELIYSAMSEYSAQENESILSENEKLNTDLKRLNTFVFDESIEKSRANERYEQLKIEFTKANSKLLLAEQKAEVLVKAMETANQLSVQVGFMIMEMESCAFKMDDSVMALIERVKGLQAALSSYKEGNNNLKT